MPVTYVAISTTTVGSGGTSSVDIQNIPASYTDLVLFLSIRTSSNDSIYISFNNSTANFSGKFLEGNGAAAASGAMANGRYIMYPVTTTSDTFAAATVYIPNYLSSVNKAYATDAVMEANSVTGAYQDLNASIWSDTPAINRITITPSAYTISQHSTVSLYGIKKD